MNVHRRHKLAGEETLRTPPARAQRVHVPAHKADKQGKYACANEVALPDLAGKGSVY